MSFILNLIKIFLKIYDIVACRTAKVATYFVKIGGRVLYFVEKCTLVAGHFILNQIVKKVDLGQGNTNKAAQAGNTETRSRRRPWPNWKHGNTETQTAEPKWKHETQKVRNTVRGRLSH